MSRTTRREEELISATKSLYDDEIEHLSRLRRSIERRIYNTKKRRDRRINWLRGFLAGRE